MAYPTTVAQKATTQAPLSVGTASGAISRGKRQRAKRVVIFSPGGGGKSTICSHAPEPVFVDLEDSSDAFDVARVTGLQSFDAVRATLQNVDMLSAFRTVVLDSGTKLEELDVAWTLANIRTQSGDVATSIESYGYGKGYQHVFDSFMPVLGDLDRLVDRGINVVIICHECISDTPNPDGENYIRYEPRLQASKGGKASIRDRVCEWADTVAYISFDVSVDKKAGKARGQGTRTIYFEQRPTWRAKHRGERIAPMAWNDPKNDGGFWNKVLA